MVYTREAGSGTLTYFMQSFMGSDSLVATAKQLNSNGLIKQAVASNSNAIGFLSFGYLDSTVKALPIGGVTPTLDSAKSGKYPYVRPFLLLTKGDPQGLAKDFIQYCLSPEVQPIIAQNYLTLQ
jgi:phosphate transport system substrate-binding protein